MIFDNENFLWAAHAGLISMESAGRIRRNPMQAKELRGLNTKLFFALMRINPRAESHRCEAPLALLGRTGSANPHAPVEDRLTQVGPSLE
ncbi:MAG TPA: hypothetical protein VMT22_06415 [Terriglobales bacterium]|jgi:hypothetical protein|nr:hypothetical protein [Terriglobales bacterium]